MIRKDTNHKEQLPQWSVATAFVTTMVLLFKLNNIKLNQYNTHHGDQYFKKLSYLEQTTKKTVQLKMCMGKKITYMDISKRIEIKSLKKILTYTNKHGPQKKTNLATYTGMSYSRFILLLNVSIMMNFIVMLEEPSLLVAITEPGKVFLEKLLKNDSAD